jgi:NADP-reducing hydrogenase subunit HndB
MIGLDFLKRTDIFAGLNDEQLNQIMAACHEKGYESGQRLFAEGDNSDRVWTVMEGQVDLRFDLPGRPTSEENTIFSITEGNSLGWSSFVPPFKYKLSAYCATRNCKMLQVKKEYLLNFFEKDVRMGYQVISNLTGVASTHFHQLQNSATGPPVVKVKITVHLATCGIAAGAREVMNALVEEISQANRPDIQVGTSGCIGRCESEPNVTVEIGGEDPIVYQKMTSEKIRQVFKEHVLAGQVQEMFRLT